MSSSDHDPVLAHLRALSAAAATATGYAPTISAWGAELALRYTLAHPDRVTGLVYVSGIGVDPESTWQDDYERNLRDRLGDRLERWQEL